MSNDNHPIASFIIGVMVSSIILGVMMPIICVILVKDKIKKLTSH